MTFVASATVVGALISADAASSAAGAQAKSAREANDLQREIFERNIELQEPFRQAGIYGQNQLLTLLGLGGNGQYDESAYNKALSAYNAQLAGIDRSRFITGAGVMAGSGDSGQDYYSSGTFDQKAYDAARAGIAAPNREDFRLTGSNSKNPMFGKYATAEYTPAMFAKGMDPGYQFRLKEGMKGLESSAAARGNLLSGGTLKGIQRYGQDMASQEYTNAFNRYQAERAGTLNPFQSLAGQGQTAANTIGNMGMNYANQVGENYMGAGNARASGYIGQANAIGGGISNLSNQYYQNQLLNRAFPDKNAALIKQYGGGNVYGPGFNGYVPTTFNPNLD
jgi:hypothetical protein